MAYRPAVQKPVLNREDLAQLQDKLSRMSITGRGMSPAVRKKLAEAMRRRWAQAGRAGRTKLGS